jgi:hypothetical protein
MGYLFISSPLTSVSHGGYVDKMGYVGLGREIDRLFPSATTHCMLTHSTISLIWLNLWVRILYTKVPQTLNLDLDLLKWDIDAANIVK